MKWLKFLFVAFLAVLVMPFAVFAEDEVKEIAEEDNKKVNVYLFRGDGCPHCADAEAFFESIEDELGEYFTLVDYETWKNSDNAALLEKVADARGEEVGGVPYIIIGNKSWNGYSSEYDDDFKDAIMAEYETSITERYDIMELVDTGSTGKGATTSAKNTSTSDAVALVAILIVLGGIVAGVIAIRKKTV